MSERDIQQALVEVMNALNLIIGGFLGFIAVSVAIEKFKKQVLTAIKGEEYVKERERRFWESMEGKWIIDLSKKPHIRRLTREDIEEILREKGVGD